MKLMKLSSIADLHTTVSNNLEVIRRTMHLSQSAFAKETSVDNGHLSKILHNKIHPRIAYLQKVSSAFRVPLVDIIGLDITNQDLMFDVCKHYNIHPSSLLTNINEVNRTDKDLIDMLLEHTSEQTLTDKLKELGIIENKTITVLNI